MEMTRLTRQKVYQMFLDAGSISTPILDMYFKRVYVGTFMKDEIDKAMRRFKWDKN